MNYLETDEPDRPKTETRARGDRPQARCPSCGAFRPAFAITKLSPGVARAKGAAWACDGCLSRWDRDPDDETTFAAAAVSTALGDVRAAAKGRR